MSKIINITKADADSFEGYIESDQFTDAELTQLGYYCGNADVKGNVFHIPCYGSYDTSCNYDHEVILDTEAEIYVYNELSHKTVKLSYDDIDFYDFEDSIINTYGPEIWQSWYEGLGDYYYDLLMDK